MSRLNRFVPALLALGLVLAACGESATTSSPAPSSLEPTASPTPTVTASPSASASAAPSSDASTPDGWARVSVAEAGFSVAVPDAWVELSPDAMEESGLMDELVESNPDAAEALQQAGAAIRAGQIALFAFDASGDIDEDGFATNLNVINVGAVEGDADQAADEMSEAIREQIPVVGEVTGTTTTLPAGEAALVEYAWEVASPDGAVTTVRVSQYAIIGASGTGYILSLSAAESEFEAQAETFRGIAESFREEPA